MKKSLEEVRKKMVALVCEHCQIQLFKPTYFKRYECPICRRELVIHIEKKEVKENGEGKKTESPEVGSKVP